MSDEQKKEKKRGEFRRESRKKHKQKNGGGGDFHRPNKDGREKKVVHRIEEKKTLKNSSGRKDPFSSLVGEV